MAWGAIDEPFEGGEIRARLIGPQAGLLGSEIQVNTFTDHQQACPNLGVRPDDGFVVEWLSNQQDGSRSGHYYQRFDAAASRFGVETRLDSNIADADQCGDFAMDPHGNFVAVWTTTPIPSPNCSDVVGRLFRADGTPIGPDFHLAKDFGPCEEAPRVTFGPNGIITAVWQRFNGEDDDLVYARYAASPGVEACVVRGKTLLCDGGRTGGEFEISIPRGSAPTLAGDLDGDGRDDLCTRGDGVFRCDLDHRGAPAELSLAFGPPAGIGLLGDFDGDGQDDPCVVEVGSLLCDLAHDGGAVNADLVALATGNDLPPPIDPPRGSR